MKAKASFSIYCFIELLDPDLLFSMYFSDDDNEQKILLCASEYF